MANSPRHLVLDVEWPPGAGGARREVFGPWAEAQDESHLEEILRLVRALNRRPGPHPRAVTMILCTGPAEWLAGEATTGGSGSPA